MPDYEKWQFEELMRKAQRRGIPGAEKLERPHLVATLEIADAEASSLLLFLGLLAFNAAVWAFTTVFWIPTEGVVDARSIRTVVGILGSINLLATLAVLSLQLRVGKLKGQFRKITDEEQVKNQTGLMT